MEEKIVEMENYVEPESEAMVLYEEASRGPGAFVAGLIGGALVYVAIDSGMKLFRFVADWVAERRKLRTMGTSEVEEDEDSDEGSKN